ncbi:MAG: N-acetylglucosamine-6-phosphate deacetylase [Frondihabitans sp.]|nr:N-acetylglucosamine-6-phosphate deacetylase [Frondihabitans sp.]
MSFVVTNATVVDARGEVPGSWIRVYGDSITATGTGQVPAAAAAAAAEQYDADGAVVTPGLIDLHGHGGGGHSYDGDEADIEAALQTHRAHGTTRSLLSLVANPLPSLEKSLGLLRDLTARDPLVLGAHLEGPFLSPDNRGAHHPHFLALPTHDVVDSLLDAAAGALRLITIAPELPGGLDAVSTLSHEGVVVAVGHTIADYDLAREAFDRGATVLTHAFNAMPGIHHRAPGPIVAAIDSVGVVLELILDGVHVHPSVAALLFAAAPDRIALITDAMAAAGALDGEYRLGSLDVTVLNGTALVAGTETIAGSTLTQDVALQLAVDRVGLSRRDAVTALTLTPARVLGHDDRLGLVAVGYAADLVVWNDDWSVREVWGAGRSLVA